MAEGPNGPSSGFQLAKPSHNLISQYLAINLLYCLLMVPFLRRDPYQEVFIVVVVVVVFENGSRGTDY